jgi:hypothetical protein
MKTKTLLTTVALLMLACQPKIESDETVNLDLMEVSPPPMACMNAPMDQKVQFVPPVIKDDAVEEDSKTVSNKVSKIKKIIKDGTVSIKVKNVEAAKKYMDAIIKKYDGYYENEEFENYEERSRYVLKIRVPCKQFESFLNAIENGEGEIISKTINARDVTEEYVDGEIRLTSKRLFRRRYNELLSKAVKIEDILAIEENSRTLQEEIESQEGRLKFLDDQITYSTLDVTLFTEKIITDVSKAETFLQRVKISISNGWETLIAFVIWCIKQWPWLIVIALVFTFIKIILKRRKNKKISKV